ncbi:hypothetical protein Tco_0641832 [Tanacetum coccineum]
MLPDTEDNHHGASDAKHNLSQLLRLLSKEVCFISHRDQHASIDFLISRSLILKRWQSAPAFDYQITNGGNGHDVMAWNLKRGLKCGEGEVVSGMEEEESYEVWMKGSGSV